MEVNELEFDPHCGEFEAFLYSPSKRFLGIIRNEIALLGFLVKVKETGSEGYYIIYKGKKYKIKKQGRIDDFPIRYMNELLKAIVGF